MENLKFVLIAIVVLILFGLTGYWAVSSIQSGSEHVKASKLEELANENEELKKEVEKLKNELGPLREVASQEKPKEEPVVENPVVTYKNQALIDELEKLINDNIFLKSKSRGTRVGTVQKFLNIYNNTSSRIDNDYGEGTKIAVAAFQKKEGLSPDGEAGPGTFRKMIDWLKTKD